MRFNKTSLRKVKVKLEFKKTFRGEREYQSAGEILQMILAVKRKPTYNETKN